VAGSRASAGLGTVLDPAPLPADGLLTAFRAISSKGSSFSSHEDDGLSGAIGMSRDSVANPSISTRIVHMPSASDGNRKMPC
jgi:hypothetical protein